MVDNPFWFSFSALAGIICGSDHDAEPIFRPCRSRDSVESDETEAENVDKQLAAELSDASTDTSGLPNQLDLTNDHSCCPSREISLEDSDPEPGDKPLLDPSPLDIVISPVHSMAEETKTSATSGNLPTAATAQQPEPTKGVNFTNIFGATKKVIFRTTQNIIENHERKNALRAKYAATIGEAEKKSPKHNEISPALSPVALTPASSGTTTASTTPTAIPAPITSNPHEQSDDLATTTSMARNDKCQNGLLRFLESPIFNVHFALHYLFYSKEPGVLSFIGNKIFSFKDQDVDLYIPQLILMYIQMNELAEVLDPYLVYRCRRAVDFCLKCLWLLEAYNYNADSFVVQNSCDKKTHLRLIRQFYPVNEQQQLLPAIVNGDAGKEATVDSLPAYVKTHHR